MTLQTLPSQKTTLSQPLGPGSSNETSNVDDDEPKEDQTLSALQLLSIPVVRSICVSTFLLGFLAAGFGMSVVLVAYARKSDGGLSLPVRHLNVFYCAKHLPVRFESSAIRNWPSTRSDGRFVCILETQPYLVPSAVSKFEIFCISEAHQALHSNHEHMAYYICWFRDSWSYFTWKYKWIPGHTCLDCSFRYSVLVKNRMYTIHVRRIFHRSRRTVYWLLLRSLIMMLVKTNTPTPASLGSLNGLTELVQAISIVISPTLIGYALRRCLSYLITSWWSPF